MLHNLPFVYILRFYLGKLSSDSLEMDLNQDTRVGKETIQGIKILLNPSAPTSNLNLHKYPQPRHARSIIISSTPVVWDQSCMVSLWLHLSVQVGPCPNGICSVIINNFWTPFMINPAKFQSPPAILRRYIYIYKLVYSYQAKF